MLTASEGEITSPGYPGNYMNNLNCTYVIVGDGQTENIIIDLVELDLESTTDCRYDWLVIDDGPILCNPTPFYKTYAFLDRFVIKFGTDGSNTRRGFKIRYSFESDAHDNCTSINLKTFGQISTPCYSCNCTYNNCTNTIIGNGKLQILTLDFVSLNFTTSANCDLGWLAIDGGPRICPSIPFKKSYAFFGSVDIVTRGGNRSVDSCAGFVVNYVVEDTCSTTLTASEGEITSPGYPGIPYSYLNCTYVVRGDGQHQNITIDLVQLDLEVASDCNLDWLVIDDGPRLCSTAAFHKIYVFQDRFIIKFRTDYRSTSRGFKIHYSIGMDAHDNCTSTHFTTSGQISTPCYSCNCTNNAFTNTVIGSGKLQILTLDFVSLNFTTRANCDLGWFTINGGPKICTSTPFKRTYAFFGSVDIVTKGGGRSVNSVGFVANYVVEDNCSTTLTASEGEITSPGYPGTAYHYLTCTYVVVGDGQNQSITIDLLQLDLQVVSDCSYDWLIIDDGPNLCYETTFHKTYAFQDKFIIKFRSDYRSATYGFKMHYSVGVDAHDTCTSTHLTTSGQISTPCYSCNCTYNNCTNTVIGSGKLQTLTLDFVSLIFTTSTNCDLGWFTIDSGPKLCTSTPFKTTYAFFGSVDIVTRGGNRSVDSCAGFVVNYVVEDTCSTTLTASEGEITSPGYPGIPYSYLNCTYVVRGDGQHQNITIDLVQLDLEVASDCNLDWLVIDDGPRLCSTAAFHKIYVFQDRFIIKFRTDYRSTSRGFKIHYSIGMDAHDNCTSTHFTTSGQISTPCYSCNCTNNAFTNTVIGSGKLQILTLDFVSLNFTTRANCDLGWFTINGGPKICTSTPFKRTYAFFGSVDIVTKGGGRSVNSVGFVANYVVEDNCSTTLTASEGEITSPGYPGTAYHYLTCTYVVVGDGQNQSITIDLLQLDLKVVSDCSYDWLIIDDGPNLCYETTFHKTYAFQDKFIIKFRSDYRSASYGFKMHYSVGVDAHDNCTSIHFKTSGQISTPCYSCNCTYNHCTNTIIGSGKLQTLTLDFVALNYTTSANCDLGWFTIDGGPKICASKPFQTIYALFGSVDIVTHGGDRSLDSCAGFVVNYIVEENCSMTFTANEGEITSPGYPGTRTNYFYCTYVIMGNGQNQTIAIDLIKLDLLDTSDCFFDWLVIDDGRKLCQHTTFHKTYVFRDRFIITFRTDYRRPSYGFKMHYSVGVDAHDSCTAILLQTSGQISTPCYSCNCTYNNYTNTIIGSGKLQSLTLDFVSLNYTTSPNCDLGWFTIDGGPKICTSTPFQNIYAFFGSVDIVTHGGDGPGNSCAGFVVNYVVQDTCSITLTASEGEITSPGYPGIPFNDLICTYVIVGDGQNQSITIDVVDLDLFPFPDCFISWLIINDGPKVCQNTQFHKTYVFQNRFIIKFRSDYSDFGRGFKLHYSVGGEAHENCSMTFTASEGEITSPGYPGTTISYLYCTYVIMGNEQNQSIAIDLIKLDLEATSDCSNDWLVIDDGLKLCYHTTFRKTYVFRDRFIIKFRTQFRRPSRVFKMHYSVGVDAHDNCSSIHLKTSGHISTPCFSCNCTYNNCTNTIIGSGKLQTLILDFVSLNYATSPNCDLGWFTIDGGPKICTSKPFQTIYAFFGSVDIVTHGGDRSVGSCGGFVVNYIVEDVDNNLLTYTTNSGRLTGPLFPGAGSSNPVTYTYIIIGHFPRQRLILDITLRSSYGGCYFAKLTLNGTEDLYDAGRYSRAYLSENNFTLEFTPNYDASFLVHYEKEDVIKGNT
ncbi:cubilin-like [Haliotis rufescens]|uniref:cubilin-like n=1 Tax=Haliotis rufescens TaxID=6454 RepID=UPI00201ED556|nr:cubilin-like [Haliotis rufescens]